MNNKIQKMYTNLVQEKIDDFGFLFFKRTSCKKFKKVLRVNKIYFKLYPRFPQFSLKLKKNTKNNLLSSLKKCLVKRSSIRKSSKKDLSFRELSVILYYSCGIKNFKKYSNDVDELIDKSKRFYPSAGARYPLEVYLGVFNVKNFSPGIYHYNVKWNTLELLCKGNFAKLFGKKITNQNWIKKFKVVFILTAVFPRTTLKYKERGWRYIFIETGHLAQNIYLLCAALNFNCCSIGGFIDDEVIKLLDLKENVEVPIYLIAVG